MSILPFLYFTVRLGLDIHFAFLVLHLSPCDSACEWIPVPGCYICIKFKFKVVISRKGDTILKTASSTRLPSGRDLTAYIFATYHAKLSTSNVKALAKRISPDTTSVKHSHLSTYPSSKATLRAPPSQGPISINIPLF
ncbi:uncharacterized protein EV420DRAFT_1643255 [Desarmillaria tabescens]|uniref:Uncharacterized protein n=1 Tax=Armillaria tabescens TaxID=1929756 RepID=A0AA39KDL1_ARMTA|nr:uncharacterized protein EV420DRAFT_1643255 [Desarmillaria tabescens]KAK0457916.1 hypothetical protein EV420DRAFT_1643255 [Desarmillaria tabescens]